RDAGADDRAPLRGARGRARGRPAQGAADGLAAGLLRGFPGPRAGGAVAARSGSGGAMIPWALLAQAVREPAAHETAEKAAEGAAEHQGIAEILRHHVVNHHYGDLYLFGVNVGPSKHLLWFGIAAALVLVIVRLAMLGYRKDRVPHGLAAAVE